MTDIFTAAPETWGPNGEAWITWFMNKYGVDRDPAVGGIAVFVAGRGQPSAELFTEFPDLAQVYYAALKTQGTITEPASDVPEVPPAT